VPAGAQKATSCNDAPAVRSTGLGGASGSQPQVAVAQEAVAQRPGAATSSRKVAEQTLAVRPTPGLGGATGGAAAAYVALSAQDLAAPSTNARDGTAVQSAGSRVGVMGLGGTSGAVAFGRPAPDPDAEDCATNL